MRFRQLALTIKPLYQLCYPLVLALCLSVSLFISATFANAEERSLKLYYIHTNERAEIVFWRDGHYDRDGLKKINIFLRDWRRNEPTDMDPRLLTLIWSVYQASGSHAYIHVISGYRSPTTNNMLRLRSAKSGVAKNSQHTLGHALDFYLPDVPLAKLRAIGLAQQAGGVGYYPMSGSPFVHMDIGNVRHWPRMSRKELMALFPDGKTLHIPSDGKPLSGYAQAALEYRQRGGLPMMLASNSSAKKSSFLATLFSRNGQSLPATDVATRETSSGSVGLVAKNSQLNSFLNLEKVPIPMAAPQPSEIFNEDNAGDNLSQFAYGDIPLPEFKGDIVSDPINTADVTKVAENGIAVMSPIPVPTDRPQKDDRIAETIAATVTASTLPIVEDIAKDNRGLNGKDDDSRGGTPEVYGDQGKQTSEASLAVDVGNGVSDPVNAIINANAGELIPVPNDGDTDDEEEDFIDVEDRTAQRAETPYPPTAQVGGSNQLHDDRMGANVAQPYAANVATRDDKNDKSTSNVKQADAEQIANHRLTERDELLQLPHYVFTTGLEKRHDENNIVELKGRAIEFRAVARID